MSKIKCVLILFLSISLFNSIISTNNILNCSEHCIECNSTLNGSSICTRCENNEYRITESGKCEHCYLYNCEKCHYDSKNNTKVECDKCKEEYYKNFEGYCKKCYEVYIGNGYCRSCSDNNTNYMIGSCRCYDGYALVGYAKCVSCPKRCNYCIYNNNTNDFECLRCSDYYT